MNKVLRELRARFDEVHRQYAIYARCVKQEPCEVQQQGRDCFCDLEWQRTAGELCRLQDLIDAEIAMPTADQPDPAETLMDFLAVATFSHERLRVERTELYIAYVRTVRRMRDDDGIAYVPLDPGSFERIVERVGFTFHDLAGDETPVWDGLGLMPTQAH